MNNNFDIFIKNNEIIKFTKDSLSYNKNWCYDWFVKNYENWENETFDTFDKFLDKDKIFIDIGGWVGTTCLYGAKKSKHVYVVEADPISVVGLISNCNINNLDNVTVIDKPIYEEDNIEIKFGKNMFTKAEWNTSTSQILFQEKEDYNKNDFIFLKTITFSSIINTFNIEPSSISLIKIDIEGGEEYILEEVYNFHKKFNIPLYIGFHIEWWNNKDINRFKFLNSNQLEILNKNKFASILFE